jgi:hypothetical protein
MSSSHSHSKCTRKSNKNYIKSHYHDDSYSDNSHDILERSECDETKIIVCILSTYCECDTETSDGYSSEKYEREIPRKEQTKNLINLFEDPIFMVKVFNIPAPYGIGNSDDMSVSQALEAHRVGKVLKHCKKYYPYLNVLILKDNSVSAADKHVLAKTCRAICDEPDWDLCYLCKWLDRCDLYENVRYIRGETITIVQTKSPHGIQALMISPCGRDIMLGKKYMRNDQMFPTLTKPLDSELNEQIEKDNLYAICTNPNLFMFDVNCSSSISDLAKMSICRRPENKERDETSVLPFMWFVVIVLGVILLAWAFWFLGPRHRNQK